MKRKIWIACASLLGFASACSGVRHPRSAAEPQPAEPQEGEETVDSLPAIRLMYGVPPVRYRVQEKAEQEQLPDAAPAPADEAEGAARRQER